MRLLDQFHPAIASWFIDQFGEPTPAQRLGWPAIASGEHTLIVAPTGSGKTLAAFLAALDHTWQTPRTRKGVRILYISPLKALNQDVWHNLQRPLAGILERSHAIGVPLDALSVAVRSGDTPAPARAAIVRKPPDILITTPESLYLMLTSRAREVLRGVSHVIVDEIHAVCGNKRGAFLALLLERLQAICASNFVRIGLSATQRPLEEVARYLGGLEWEEDLSVGRRAVPRPVTIVDAGRRRDLDLQVIWPRDSVKGGTVGSIWPEIERTLLKLVREHRSTIIFANNRRTVEKLTARLNERALASDAEADPPIGEDGTERVGGPFRAHHGSISLDERRGTEEALKEGDLTAVVATASLELGIDMGAVDLVCQVESPGNVARGLQRVGRAGHVVRGTSKGRLIAKTSGDLLESAALCRAMEAGDIEHLRVPLGCLDVLAQQVVACVAMDPWEVPALFDLVRSAYPFHGLTADSFENVLRLISGRFPTPDFRDLRARVSWDRIHNALAPLPGTAQLALVGGGTIPDTGQFPVYLGEGGPRLGELDEEFVYERRVGETFVLGNSTWRIQAIDPHRVVVSAAEGHAAVMPFWRGESVSRSPELGLAVGALCREVAERLDDPALTSWLEQQCRLTHDAALALRNYVLRQKLVSGAVPHDQCVVIESYIDPAGELGLAVLSPFGGRLHHALKLALVGRIRERFGLAPACLHSDDGLLFRLPAMDEPPLDLLEGLTGEVAERLVREELPETALFGLRFRQNAARALLMPRPDPSKRTPLWLQRLRAKDLLQVARKFPDFPILLETVRECLDDDLELPRLRAFLDRIETGSISVVRRAGEEPSPFVADMIFQFTAAHVYEWDDPKRTDRGNGSIVDESLLEPLLRANQVSDWLDVQAIARVENRLRGMAHPPRTIEEMAERLRQLGDISSSELTGPMEVFLAELGQAGRAIVIDLPGTTEPARWISTEERSLYEGAFSGVASASAEARSTIARRFLATHALIGLGDLTARYPIDRLEAIEMLEGWSEAGTIVRLGNSGIPEHDRWTERDHLAQMRRATLAARRQETIAVAPEVFADFVLRRQHLAPASRGQGADLVETVLDQLQGLALPAGLWESEILPRRVVGFQPRWLDDVLGGGTWLWRARGAVREDPLVAFFRRDAQGLYEVADEVGELDPDLAALVSALGGRGASFASDLARVTGMEPTRVRRGQHELLLRGLVTNDRFDPVRAGSQETLMALTEARAARSAGFAMRQRGRRSMAARPEGRWSLLDRFSGDPDARLVAWGDILLDRYGVLTREILALEPFAPEWSELAPVLSRSEWRGELRRGYFVEGLSGVQYASEEAAHELARLSADGDKRPPAVAVCAADPANLYGAGAPFDIELLEGGVARLPRLPGNFLILMAGRPVVIVESFGKRLTGLGSARAADIDSALKLLPGFITPHRRILKVESYNGAPAAESPAAERLAELGFVRDYLGMAFYAGWDAGSSGS